MAVWLALSLLAFVVLVSPAACRADVRSCYAGDYASCSCSEDNVGYRACVVAEGKYGPCVCDGTTPGLDGSFEAATDTDAGVRAKLPFMSQCTRNEECETGTCHTFSQQGSFCTKGCKSTVDCPAPSSGCNNRGICKAP